MSNNKSICSCNNCDQEYCLECTDDFDDGDDDLYNFCSIECRDEYNRDHDIKPKRKRK